MLSSPMRRAFSVSLLSAPSDGHRSQWGAVVDVTWGEARSGGKPLRGKLFSVSAASAARTSSQIRVVIVAATLVGRVRKLGGMIDRRRSLRGCMKPKPSIGNWLGKAPSSSGLWYQRILVSLSRWRSGLDGMLAWWRSSRVIWLTSSLDLLHLPVGWALQAPPGGGYGAWRQQMQSAVAGSVHVQSSRPPIRVPGTGCLLRGSPCWAYGRSRCPREWRGAGRGCGSRRSEHRGVWVHIQKLIFSVGHGWCSWEGDRRDVHLSVHELWGSLRYWGGAGHRGGQRVYYCLGSQLDSKGSIVLGGGHSLLQVTWGLVRCWRVDASNRFLSGLDNPTWVPFFGLGGCVESRDLRLLFRWFKFTLKPPNRITRDKLWLAIWDTSFWTFLVKFGHNGPWDIS